MMNKADIDKARELFSDRQIAEAVRDMVTSQPVRLVAGEGKDAKEIFLSPAYRDRIVTDVVASLDRQIAEVNAKLTDMGVEP